MRMALLARALFFLTVGLIVRCSEPLSHVWPKRNWRLQSLTDEQYATWERQGYLVIPNAVPLNLTRAAASAIRAFVGANETDVDSWYQNTLDIYKDRLQNGKIPHHGPCGMLWLYHHESLWAIRQHPNLHAIFSDVYGTHRLYVTVDRAHFKPPQHPSYPAWSDPGDVHFGLHWDVDTREASWPVPFVVQGTLYLEDTKSDQGALRVVPGFHRRFEAWSASQPANRSAERPEGIAANALSAEAVAVEGEAGSLVIWHSLLPHGPAPNWGTAPRISAYVSMLPVDASPFLGPTRPSDAPLSMVDAGTLSYLEELQAIARPEEANDIQQSGSSTCKKPAGMETCGDEGVFGKPGRARKGLRRQSRERRVERWRLRLPLLDEDPREDQLARLPPGEVDGKPAQLTPLGERLVGLVEWDLDTS